MKNKKTPRDSRFVVRRAAEGSGKGLFAAEPIKKGGFILEYIGEKIPTSLANTLKTRYLFEIDNQWTIDGSTKGNESKYINHSCDPNCETEHNDGRIVIHAIKNIKKGEQLTYDYDEEYYDEFIKLIGCKCGARKHKS